MSGETGAVRPGAAELRACLASVKNLARRAQRLEADMKLGIEPHRSEHAITFAEVRSLDLLCVDALERNLPGRPELASEWEVSEEEGLGGLSGLDRALRQKAVRLQLAIDIAEATSGDAAATETLPRPYGRLAEAQQLFFEDRRNDCQDYDRNVFIMTRFEPENETLGMLDAAIRATLRSRDLVGHRADDRCYTSDRNLWDNVCTYMLSCKFGVAVLENILVDEFNPNVALEYGFMRALGKPTLLLKERRFEPRADILGTLWNEFDILDPQATAAAAVHRWLDDLDVPALPAA